MVVVVVMVATTATAPGTMRLLRLSTGGGSSAAIAVTTRLVLGLGALDQSLDRVQLILEPRRTLLINLDKLLRQLVQQVSGH